MRSVRARIIQAKEIAFVETQRAREGERERSHLFQVYNYVLCLLLSSPCAFMLIVLLTYKSSYLLIIEDG